MDNNKEYEEIVEKLTEQYKIKEQVTFDEYNLQEKLKENTFLQVMYSDLHQENINKYEQLELLLEKLMGNRYSYYKFEDQRELTKNEIENYFLPSDKKIIQMKNILRKQKVYVGFFKTCMEGVKSMSWQMKQFIESKKNYD